MRLETSDTNEYIGSIITYLNSHKDDFVSEEKARISEALGNFSILHALYDNMCLQICDELGLLPDKQNPYKAFSNLINETFDIEDKNVVEIGGGKLARLSKRISAIQVLGKVTVYDPNSVIIEGNYHNLVLAQRKFGETSDVKDVDLLVGLMSYPTASVAIKMAIENKIDFMIAVFNKRNQYSFSEGSEFDLKPIFNFVNMAEKKVENSGLGKLKVKRINEIGKQFPIIYNERG